MCILLAFYHRIKANRSGTHTVTISKFLQKFSYRQLKSATRNFSDSYKLGQGGYGAVYKGILRSGVEIAVKKVDISSLQGEQAFQNEISMAGRVDSPQIVQLLGFCAHGPSRFLVYEYMANRSLQEALFDEVHSTPLDWHTRFRIIVNIAQGLAYLHVKCDPTIIHGDVKPSNILLDAHFQAKVADFGLAKVKSQVSPDEVHIQIPEAEAMENERIRYERAVRSRAKRQRRREEAERKKKAEKVIVATVNLDSKDLDAERKSTVSRVNGSEGEQDGVGAESLPERGIKAGEGVADTDVKQESFALKKWREEESGNGEENGGLDLETSQGGGDMKAGDLDVDLKLENISSLEELEAGPSTFGTPLGGGRDITVGDDVMEDAEETIWQDCNEILSPTSPVQVVEGDIFVSAEEGETDLDKSVENGRAGIGGEEGWSAVSPSQPDPHTPENTMVTKSDKPGRAWSRDWWRKDRSGEISYEDPDLIKGDGKKMQDHETNGEIQEELDFNKPWRARQRSKSSEWVGALIGELTKETKKKGPVKHDLFKGKEWWREEYCEELSNKSKEQGGVLGKGDAKLEWSGSNRGRRSHEYFNTNFSQEFSGEFPHRRLQKSRRENRRSRSRSKDFWGGDSGRGVGNTPSMRGTICYVAPEKGGGSSLSEKSDVYSFGVLLLVLISGRRPLQVTASPMIDFERANLISWARVLAQFGNLIDLVDPDLHQAFSKDQALLCLKVALLCLQRLPVARPSMEEIVKILSGEVAVPDLPFEFSPSPPELKSRRKPPAEKDFLETPPVTTEF